MQKTEFRYKIEDLPWNWPCSLCTVDRFINSSERIAEAPFMVSVTFKATVANATPNCATGSLAVPIDPLRSWFNLRVYELEEYSEQLDFLVWSDVKIPHKQTAIGWIDAVNPMAGTIVETSVADWV